MQIVVIACRVLAGLLAIGHAFDLHTTSQVLKQGKGHEADPILGWALNSPRLSEDAKFWILAGWKLLQAGLMGWAAWVAPSIWLLLGEGVAVVIYAIVLRRNWQIFKG